MLDMGVRIEQARYKVIEILASNQQLRGYIHGVEGWLPDDTIKELLVDEEKEFVGLFCATGNREIELIVTFTDDNPMISERVLSGDKGAGGMLE